MSLFFNVIGVVGSLLVLALAVVGAVVVHGMVRGEVGARRANARARDTEQRIRDIGHEAQLRICVRPSAKRRGLGRRAPATFDGWGERG